MYSLSEWWIDCSKPQDRQQKIHACRLSQSLSMECEGHRLQPIRGENDPRETRWAREDLVSISAPCYEDTCTAPSTAWTESSVEWKASGAAQCTRIRFETLAQPGSCSTRRAAARRMDWSLLIWVVAGQPELRCNSRPDCEQVLL